MQKQITLKNWTSVNLSILPMFTSSDETNKLWENSSMIHKNLKSYSSHKILNNACHINFLNSILAIQKTSIKRKKLLDFRLAKMILSWEQDPNGKQSTLEYTTPYSWWRTYNPTKRGNVQMLILSNRCVIKRDDSIKMNLRLKCKRLAKIRRDKRLWSLMITWQNRISSKDWAKT